MLLAANVSHMGEAARRSVRGKAAPVSWDGSLGEDDGVAARPLLGEDGGRDGGGQAMEAAAERVARAVAARTAGGLAVADRAEAGVVEGASAAAVWLCNG